ncbi:MAG: phosphopantetheine-binding protein [Syntrophales bacterium LBB04]|jgi:acyl carrier protein|nr:phosphopantetheine-binding protein [Syntrophales bacterium LBB04]
MEQLIDELKVRIVDILDLAGASPATMDVDGPLVGGALGLDSIDVLEIVIMIEKDYGVRIDNRELGERVFASLKTLAAYIYENSPRLKK